MLSGTRDNLDTDRYNAYIDFLVFYHQRLLFDKQELYKLPGLEIK